MYNLNDYNMVDLNLSATIVEATSLIESRESTFVFYDLNLSQEEISVLRQVKFNSSIYPIEHFYFDDSIIQSKLKTNLINFFSYKLLNSSLASDLASIVEKLYATNVYNKKEGECVDLLVSVKTREGSGHWHIDDDNLDSYIGYKNIITLVGPATLFYNTDDENIIQGVQDYYKYESKLVNDGVDNHLIHYSQVVNPEFNQGTIFNTGRVIHSAPSLEYGDDRLVIQLAASPECADADFFLGKNTTWPLDLE